MLIAISDPVLVRLGCTLCNIRVEMNDAFFSLHLQTEVTRDDSQQLILNGVCVSVSVSMSVYVCVCECLCRCVFAKGYTYV